MTSVKQYAEERKITIQAVHQSMKGKRKQALLEGHVPMVNGVKWLDDEAVQILDEDRKRSPVVLERTEKNDTIDALKEQIEMLLTENAKQANKIAELAEWKAEKAVAIAGAEQQKLLLEERTKRVEQLESAAKETMDKLREAENAAREAEDKLQRAEERAQQLKEEMSRPLSLYERLTGKRKN